MVLTFPRRKTFPLERNKAEAESEDLRRLVIYGKVYIYLIN